MEHASQDPDDHDPSVGTGGGCDRARRRGRGIPGRSRERRLSPVPWPMVGGASVQPSPTPTWSLERLLRKLLGGWMELDREAAAGAIGRIRAAFGWEVEHAAEAISQIARMNMVQLVRD